MLVIYKDAKLFFHIITLCSSKFRLILHLTISIHRKVGKVEENKGQKRAKLSLQMTFQSSQSHSWSVFYITIFLHYVDFSSDMEQGKTHRVRRQNDCK